MLYFGKASENVRKHRDIKLVTTDKKISQLASKPNYYTTKWFSQNESKNVKMNKPVYLGFN